MIEKGVDHMTTFASAVQTSPAEVFTNNGMVTFDHSGDELTTLFFAIGASRGKDLTAQFERAFQDDPLLALRVLFWARDVRGGAGERDTFRKLLVKLVELHPDTARKVLSFVSEYGRWDDLAVLENTGLEPDVLSIIAEALRSENSLCAKWTPRKGTFANKLRKFMGLDPKTYRKLLVNLTKVVETPMCAREWDTINYDHIPSVAAARYQKAFNRHDPIRYSEYKEGLKSGSNKINASAVYPYDVIKSVGNGDTDVALAQWEALPNYLGDDKIIPMVDVSGSMTAKVGGSTSLTCMDISVSLGLYIADKQKGAFKDLFLTFNTNSRIELLRGDLFSKLTQLRCADWGGSTNLESAYAEILRIATKNKVAPEDMPKFLIIFSDMEFNSATSNRSGKRVRAQDLAAERFAEVGYQLPKIVYWNLAARAGNVPVKFDENGTALVSGFSPSIMKSILAAKQFDPRSIMLETLNSERYLPITI